MIFLMIMFPEGHGAGGICIIIYKHQIQSKVAALTPVVTRGRAAFTLGIGTDL